MCKSLAPLLFALVLTACTPPQAEKTADLCTCLPLAGTRTRIDDPKLRARYDRAADAVSEATAQGDERKRKHCGQTFTSTATDTALHADIGATLGADWQPRDSFSRDGFTITLWQSSSTFWPKQYYALISPPDNEKNADDERLLRTAYITNSDSGLNGSVVFGTILITLGIVPIAIAVPLWRRRRRARNKRPD